MYPPIITPLDSEIKDILSLEEKYRNEDKSGADILRDCVEFMNSRKESLNEKGVFILLLEFANYI